MPEKESHWKIGRESKIKKESFVTESLTNGKEKVEKFKQGVEEWKENETECQ